MEEYNPILYDETLSIAGTSTSEHTVNIPDKGSSIRLYPTSGTPIVYINTTANTPPLCVVEGTSLDNPDGRIRRLIVGGDAAATLNVKIYWSPPGERVRIGVNA